MTSNRLVSPALLLSVTLIGACAQQPAQSVAVAPPPAAPVAAPVQAAPVAPPPAASVAVQTPPKAAPVYKFKTPRLSRKQFDALLAKPQNLLLIDVRRPDELSKIGGLPVYLSLQSEDIQRDPARYLAFIPKGRVIVTLSNHAFRAGAVGDLLARHGFKVVGAVGVQTYEEEGGKLAKIAPPAPSPASART
ncbi:Rhodanese-related sulfurtransferase [Solimonas aquatica]|uniref:Rhodanese-related sulfurtransferase n=1 Tax=Solimonas aquatica TaxID=489703 RepID=A0A1H9DVJ0_9GAMM|nr:rhodanese-like domain-containing protein [Solimonas aquatica]SEQ16883.1 Rhodanese-related sulfurtransferase [Solimonas aquatica]